MGEFLFRVGDRVYEIELAVSGTIVNKMVAGSCVWYFVRYGNGTVVPCFGSTLELLERGTARTRRDLNQEYAGEHLSGKHVEPVWAHRYDDFAKK